jgi:hypothetical protein
MMTDEEEGMSNDILLPLRWKCDNPNVVVIQPTRNAVIIDLVEMQMPGGAVERQTRISVECKDAHLQRDLIGIAQRIRV